MMWMLWQGQTSRHGGLGPTRAETPDEARAAVHLAASLVQFGVSGAFESPVRAAGGADLEQGHGPASPSGGAVVCGA
jgi:hypothetical protein